LYQNNNNLFKIQEENI